MRTIAISIDEESLAAIDRLARGSRAGKARVNRSEVIRRAIQEFVARQRKRSREEGDRKVLSRNREQIARQARALVSEQAEL
jgi:metal-responsive CopG/Arc/MetJ family transcriptional regulator